MNTMLRPETLPHATQAAEGMERRRFTVAEVEAMAAAGIMLEDERVELIGGELVPMIAKGNRHEVIKTALLRQWYRVAPDDLDLTPETTFRLSLDTYLEPDVIVYPRAVGLKGLNGDTALLAVEIADTSLGYDLGTKPGLYAGFGLRELWVIDAVRLRLHVFRDPLPSGFATRSEHGPEDRVTPHLAPDFALRLADLDLA